MLHKNTPTLKCKQLMQRNIKTPFLPLSNLRLHLHSNNHRSSNTFFYYRHLSQEDNHTRLLSPLYQPHLFSLLAPHSLHLCLLRSSSLEKTACRTRSTAHGGQSRKEFYQLKMKDKVDSTLSTFWGRGTQSSHTGFSVILLWLSPH